MIRYLEEHDHFGARVTISDERDLLLDTGGGLLNVSSFVGKDPFLVHNVDILTDLDLNALWNSHLEHNAAGHIGR